MRFFIFFILPLFLWGCGESRPISIDPISSGTITIGEGGTATNLPEEGGNFPAPQMTFPHDADWKNPSAHGVFVAQNGRSYCLRCHAEDPDPKIKGGAPACRSCHALYPHSKEWVRHENHGAAVRRDGQESCKSHCHGADLSGGFSRISCTRCHAVYPHRAGWRNAEEHGPAAKNDGKRICKSCHGDDFLGGTSGVSCKNCHSLYPHDSGWGNPERHGGLVLNEGTGRCATSCHGADRRGGLSGVGCESCHTLYPHPQGWAAPAEHGAAAIGAGKQTCDSANCHGAGFAGGTYGTSCFSCHADFPHILPRWMTVEPLTRRSSDRDEEFHGDKFIREVNRGNRNVCTECHGEDLDREVGDVSCKGCHPSGITHLPKQIGRELVGWRRYALHGKYFSEHFNAMSETPCWKCHGEPANFDMTQTKEDLVGQSECHRCHWAYPHRSFTFGPAWGVAPWEPVVTECGLVAGAAHITYVLSNPLFTAPGQPRPADPTDPSNIQAIINTCGRNCHADGNRSFRMQRSITLCTGYCHNPDNPNLPPPPVRPACPVPPGGGGGGEDEWEEE